MIYLFAVLVMMSVVSLVYGIATLAPARSRAIHRRLAELEGGASQHYTIQRRQRQERRARLEGLLEAFGEKVAAKRVDWSEMQRMLVQAGYRRPNAVAIYFAVRMVTVLGMAGGGTLVALASGQRPAAIMLIAAGAGLFGWVLPRTVVKRKIGKRQKHIQKALADALDLLVVCVEAGLGLNQALVRVSEEIEHVSRIMSEELMLTNLEIRAGTPRDEALRNLGDRTGVADLKALTAMLVQTDRFGTSVATALRVHSDTLRTKRRQRAEEAAAKTTIKLVVPLVFLIFPAMFVVILGPAILHILAQMKGLM
jgi:tight adherence protein C